MRAQVVVKNEKQDEESYECDLGCGFTLWGPGALDKVAGRLAAGRDLQMFGDFRKRLNLLHTALKPEPNRISFAEMFNESCRICRESQIITVSRCISRKF